ncbi:hypothetical protein PHMEG_00025206 [Phytophthora megakarya]|uniref:Integrase catalytic domain-containing protein n=1 Tax=Phytophthora megakarya TaxID=4795 RepID=A0A225VCQ4_9STRA|nr:hypothetical protein PHMEG_00025206 [Phytophthora megakarya]
MVSMDFVIPLPRSFRGSTALLLWQGSFTGFGIAKAMSDTDAVTVAKNTSTYDFGAPSLYSPEPRPRFMSEVFQALAELIQARSRSTLSYRPQANGQQERSVKTVMQSVKVYEEDPLQRDWDEIAERLVFSINNSHNMTRKETSFYLVHGWDAHTTLRAMTISMKRGVGKQTEALAWRREIALEIAKEYQAVEKARRARIHNEKLSRKEQAAVPKRVNDGSPDDDSGPRSLFRPGNRVWLYMERVKPGLVKKLAHRWRGPFRAKRKVEEFAYELELPDKSGYRFYPVVHVSRLKALKAVNEYCDRPTTRQARDIAEDARFDFDEEVLPEYSWELGEFEVKAILND